MRPNDRVSPASSRSALYISVQLAPTTIISPERMKIEKSTLSVPNSQRPTGSTNQATRPSPAAVRARRGWRSQPLGHRHRPSRASETPKPSVIAFLALIPEAIRSAPRSDRGRAEQPALAAVWRVLVVRAGCGWR